MRVITFKIDEGLLEELDRYCLREGLSRSEAIRRAIKELLKSPDSRPRYLRYGVRRVVMV